MVKYIDLSHTIENGMPVYPTDKGVKLYQESFLEKDGFNSSRLETGMHAGTHLDLPSHFLEQKITVDQLGVDRFIGNGCLLDA